MCFQLSNIMCFSFVGQIVVSCGAYSILSHVIQAFIQSGDEVSRIAVQLSNMA